MLASFSESANATTCMGVVGWQHRNKVGAQHMSGAGSLLQACIALSEPREVWRAWLHRAALGHRTRMPSLARMSGIPVFSSQSLADATLSSALNLSSIHATSSPTLHQILVGNTTMLALKCIAFQKASSKAGVPLGGRGGLRCGRVPLHEERGDERREVRHRLAAAGLRSQHG